MVLECEACAQITRDFNCHQFITFLLRIAAVHFYSMLKCYHCANNQCHAYMRLGHGLDLTTSSLIETSTLFAIQHVKHFRSFISQGILEWAKNEKRNDISLT